MNEKQKRDRLDQQLEGHTSVAEVIKDLPLYDQILNRGQTMGKLMSRNLIEVVRRQAAEIQRLTKAESDEESSHSNTIDQRDRAESMADKLASEIGRHFRVDVGEHSNMSCPWEVALDVLNGAYVTDSDQDRELAGLRLQVEQATTWQPMETVPKDDTPVLVLLPAYNDAGNKRLRERVQHAQFATTPDGKVLATIGDHFHFDKPTPLGWMLPPPIPEPSA